MGDFFKLLKLQFMPDPFPVEVDTVDGATSDVIHTRLFP